MALPESHDEYLRRLAHFHGEDLRRQREAAEDAQSRERARNSNPLSCLPSILGIVFGAVALVALYDAVAANQDTVSSAIDVLPTSWQESATARWWARGLLAVLVAAPLFVLAHGLKRLRNGVARIFPPGRAAGLARWLWLSAVTAARGLLDLIAVVVAFVSFRLLGGSTVEQFAEIGHDGFLGALLLITPVAMLRAFFLGRQLPR